MARELQAEDTGSGREVTNRNRRGSDDASVEDDASPRWIRVDLKAASKPLRLR